MAQKIMLIEFVEELQTWMHFDEDQLAKARASKMSTANDVELNDLVMDFGTGKYDEDLESLQQNVEYLINKTTKLVAHG